MDVASPRAESRVAELLGRDDELAQLYDLIDGIGRRGGALVVGSTRRVGPASDEHLRFESVGAQGLYRRLCPQIFSRRGSVRQLRFPPVDRDDPHRELERAPIERLGELGDCYEIVA